MIEIIEKIEMNFNKQGLMHTLNATLDKVESGVVQITCKFDERLSQQHKFFHAGVMASIADSACGYAAMTRIPLDKDVLSVEFKINFMKPAKTNKLIAVGKVVQSGKTLTVCEGKVYEETGQILIALMTATMMTVELQS